MGIQRNGMKISIVGLAIYVGLPPLRLIQLRGILERLESLTPDMEKCSQCKAPLTRCFNMDDACSIMRMQPIDAGIIARDTDFRRKRSLVPIDIEREMSMDMIIQLLAAFTGNTIYRGIWRAGITRSG